MFHFFISSTSYFTFLAFILFWLRVTLFMLYSLFTFCINDSTIFSLNMFCDRFSDCTLRMFFQSYFRMSSVSLFRTSFTTFTFLLNSCYSMYITHSFPSSANVKSRIYKLSRQRFWYTF